MRIAYVIDNITSFGGIQRITVAKASYFASIGYDVYIIVSDVSGPKALLEQLDERVSVIDTGTRLYEFDFKPGLINRIKRELKPLIMFRRLRKTLKLINPDILISVGLSEKYMIPLLSIGKKWITIREFHNNKLYRLYDVQYSGKDIMHKLKSYLSHFIEFHTCLSHHDCTVVLTREDKLSNWGNRNDIRVIPNPLRLAGTPLSSNGESHKVVTLSRITRIKRPDHLIAAWTIIHRVAPDWILEIWGPIDKEYGESLKKQISDARLNNSVHLCGAVHDVGRVLSSASIFAYASSYDGLPLVLLEAMSCGLPCVSYTCPCGPKDIISDGIDGLWVKNGDVQDIADKLLMLIRDEDKRKRMGKAAIEKSKQYSMEKIGQMWLALFEELVSKPKQ